MILLCGVITGDHLQVFQFQYSGSATEHLLVVALAADIAHKDQTFQRLYICTGGDHFYRHCDARIELVSEIAESLICLLRFAGDLLAEFISLSEHFSDDLNNIIRMAVVLCKDQRLWYIISARKQLCKYLVTISLDDRTDLAWIHNVHIQHSRIIGHILIHLTPSFCTGKTIPVFRHTLHDHRAVLGDLGINQIDILANIHTVNDGLLTGILADNVLIEERKCPFLRCRRQADNKGIEILQYL